ncbi:MAG: hypothetical protein ACREK3_07970 [Gemmatimonadota bacterium]
MRRIPIDSERGYHELGEWLEDAALLSDMRTLIDRQRAVAERSDTGFVPNPRAADEVSETALARIMDAGHDIHGISSDRHISNVVSFNALGDGTGLVDRELIALRRAVDDRVSARLRETFEAPYPLGVHCSGHFWYPPGGYMGWHTNSGAPGWRIYITHAREPGRSFFRYRIPDSGEIVTSHDREWDVRLFRIAASAPLWHAVYSETDRYSLGYVVRRTTRLKSATGRMRRLLAR